jgi:hypothetical protein
MRIPRYVKIHKEKIKTITGRALVSSIKPSCALLKTFLIKAYPKAQDFNFNTKALIKLIRERFMYKNPDFYATKTNNNKNPKYRMMLIPIYFHLARTLFPAHKETMFFRFAQWGSNRCVEVLADLESSTFMTNPFVEKREMTRRASTLTR